jgi:hypothetical protein
MERKESVMNEEASNRADCPFAGHNEILVNVKFFRGRRDDVITVDEILEQARSAVMQNRMKTASVSLIAPVSTHPKVDVREFVGQI